MKIVIESAEVQVKTGTSAKSGKPYTLRSQNCTFENKRFRMPGRITLGDDQAAHPVGVYELDFDATVKVNAYGELDWERVPVLLRVVDLKTKAA